MAGRFDRITVYLPSPLPDDLRLLAPCDLQAIKACGVTFAVSAIERVIEERALGDLVLRRAERPRELGRAERKLGIAQPAAGVRGRSLA